MDEGGLLYYHYRILTGKKTLLYGGEKPVELIPLADGQGERQLLVYDASYLPPESFGDGILYHIFVEDLAKLRAPVPPTPVEWLPELSVLLIMAALAAAAWSMERVDHKAA